MNVCIIINTEKKGLFFLETSALDSTNVEAAFTTVLAGNIYIYLCLHMLHVFLYCWYKWMPFLLAFPFPTFCEYLL